MKYFKKILIILLVLTFLTNILGTIISLASNEILDDDNTTILENNELTNEKTDENIIDTEENEISENVVVNENNVQNEIIKNEQNNEIVEDEESEIESEKEVVKEIITEEKQIEETVEENSKEKINEPIIEEGYYQIRPAVSSNKVLEVDAAKEDNCANVQIYTNVNVKQQKFELKYLGSGEYEIINLKSGKALDVANGGMKNGTNVWQYERNGTDAQKWYIEENGSGFYSLKSKKNGLYLDVAYGLSQNGTNIQVYEKNDTDAQKFKFIKTTTELGTKTIDDGYYSISTKINLNKVLDVTAASEKNNANIQIWTNVNERQQIFKVNYVGSGYYTIQNLNSKKYLDVAYGGTSKGTNVWQHDGNKTNAQYWIIREEKDGFYSIISKCSDLYLDVDCGSDKNGTNVKTYEYNGNPAQKFKFTKVEVIQGTKTLENGTYKIFMKQNQNKVLDVSNGSKSNGANVRIWDYNDTLAQKFKIDYIGDGYYKITNVNSGKVLDVEGANSADGTNVQQFESNGTNAQKWIIKSDGNGSYNIISALGNKYLTVAGGSTAMGTNITIYKANGTDSQKFNFGKVKTITLERGTYGSSGLKIKGDPSGKSLEYYKIGYGPNVFFATFAVHGWEDSWSYDGTELTKIAESFKEKLISMQDENLAKKWSIYIFPSVNPDGEYHGTSHNGPGRCSLYSSISSHKGMDINRCFSTSWTRNTSNRNYNGTEPFQAYEARYLRDFLLENRATNGKTILVDLHGWLNETIGDSWIGSKYAAAFGMNKHIDTYGKGYLVNWARSNLGYNGVAARAALIELPMVYNSNDVVNRNFSNKYINATLEVLRQI